MVIQVNFCKNELMVKIYSTSLVRAIGKVLLMNLARTPIKIHKGDGKWPLLVYKQLLWWSILITYDNNNDVLTDLQQFFSRYTLQHTSVGLTSCISIAFPVGKCLTCMTILLHVMSFNGKFQNSPQ